MTLLHGVKHQNEIRPRGFSIDSTKFRGFSLCCFGRQSMWTDRHDFPIKRSLYAVRLGNARALT